MLSPTLVPQSHGVTSLPHWPPPFSPPTRLTFSQRWSSAPRRTSRAARTQHTPPGQRPTPALQFLSVTCLHNILVASFLFPEQCRLGTCHIYSLAAMVSGKWEFGDTKRMRDLPRIFMKVGWESPGHWRVSSGPLWALFWAWLPGKAGPGFLGRLEHG